jgi:TM2 domain-containing membrane protein YozV/DNA-directed RNA polymerase subunit RPC12/RpoP
MVQFACPACQQPLEHPTSGAAVKCPSCGHRFDVPAGEPVEAVAAATVAGPAGKTKGPGEKFCHECGAVIRARAEICPKCGVRQPPLRQAALYAEDDPRRGEAASSKLAAGICAILLGSLGIHKFILGLTEAGLIMLLVTLLTCGVGFVPMWVIGIVEGIIYLTRSNEEFYQTYFVEKKGWF